MGTLARGLGYCSLFAVVAIVSMVLLATGGRFVGDIVSAAPSDAQDLSALAALVGGLAAAAIVTRRRMRHRPMRPLWLGFGAFMVLWAAAAALGTYVRVTGESAARAAPVAGIYWCANSQVIRLTEGRTIRLPVTRYDAPSPYTYDPESRVISFAGDEEIALRYVPLGESGFSPDWQGPGIELAVIVNLPAIVPGVQGRRRSIAEPTWCPLDRTAQITE